MNNVIQSKIKKEYKCSLCETIHVKMVVYCHYCKKYNTIIEKELPPKKYTIPKVSAKKKQENIQSKGVVTELDKYFDYHIAYIKEHGENCAECSVPLFNPTRWNVCHILAKSLFPSCATLHENVIYLCREHHGQMDSNYENAKKMNIWDEVKATVQSFIHLVKEKHKHLEHFK